MSCSLTYKHLLVESGLFNSCQIEKAKAFIGNPIDMDFFFLIKLIGDGIVFKKTFWFRKEHQIIMQLDKSENVKLYINNGLHIYFYFIFSSRSVSKQHSVGLEAMSYSILPNNSILLT